MSLKVHFAPINEDGTPRGYAGPLPEVAREVFRATVDLYETVGFDVPWIGYLALADETPVGACGFKSLPENGRVEIAYFMFPRGGSGNSDSVISGSLASAKPPRGGDTKERGNEEDETEPRSDL
ncbi:MAG: hypothetical protein AMXMBFR67_11010 [Nitrospira sp.]